MAVTYDNAQQVGATSFLLRWRSDLVDPTFRVFRNGKLISESKRSSKLFTTAPGEADNIEVLDDPNEVPLGLPGAGIHLAWNSVNQATSYLVERYQSGNWTRLAIIAATGAARYQTPANALGDDDTHNFRVSALTAIGGATPAPVDYQLVRVPDEPYVGMTFDDGDKTVTVEAA